MDVDKKIVTLAEKFLVCCICKDENINTFDQLCNMVYYKKYKKLDLEKISSGIIKYFATHKTCISAIVILVAFSIYKFGN